MTEFITAIWDGLRAAGLPEVMLFLPDGSASRCHWDDTAVIDGLRVALLGDQDRKIVRIIPVDGCLGIGIASPKGIESDELPRRRARKAQLRVRHERAHFR